MTTFPPESPCPKCGSDLSLDGLLPMTMDAEQVKLLVVYDKHGIPIHRGDIVKVFHFVDARRKRHYMYKQCIGPGSYKNGRDQYVFFSHLNFNDTISSQDGPYHENPGKHLPHYEIVQSIKQDHDARAKAIIKAELQNVG